MVKICANCYWFRHKWKLKTSDTEISCSETGTYLKETACSEFKPHTKTKPKEDKPLK